LEEKLSKVTQEEIDHMTIPITTKEIEFAPKNYSTKETPDRFTGKFYQIHKK
jgi:hypothetical protein